MPMPSITGFQDLCQKSLALGAQEAAPIVRFDESGYVSDWRENLICNVDHLAIYTDFGSGAGYELSGKFRASYSSAALVANSFGSWRRNPQDLEINGRGGFDVLRFEVQLGTGLGGTPPHLDVLATGEHIVAVESKCTEWMKTSVANFSSSYEKLAPLLGDSSWFRQMTILRKSPGRIRSKIRPNW
jgi:hypothetical protein